MPFDQPFPLGPFSVDATGRLYPTTEGRFPAFHVRWRGHGVDVAMERMQDASGLLALVIRAGRIGSSADDAADISQPRRQRAFTLLHQLRPLLPADWRLELAADHCVRLLIHHAIAMPARAHDLLTLVTHSLLAAAPYLDVLAEDGVLPGSEKTCPG